MQTDNLKNMLQDLINSREEQAQAVLHDYFVEKMQTILTKNNEEEISTD